MSQSKLPWTSQPVSEAPADIFQRHKDHLLFILAAYDPRIIGEPFRKIVEHNKLFVSTGFVKNHTTNPDYGVSHYCVTPDDFARMKENGEFADSGKTGGFDVGLTYHALERTIKPKVSTGRHAVLITTYQQAVRLKSVFPSRNTCIIWIREANGALAKKPFITVTAPSDGDEGFLLKKLVGVMEEKIKKIDLP